MAREVTFKNNGQAKSNKESDDREAFSSPANGNKSLDNESWATQLLQVYGGTAYIKYPHIEPGGITLQSTLEPSSLSLQEGVTVTPDIAQVSAYGDGKDGASSGVIFTALGGRVEFATSNFQKVKKVEAQLATMNIVADNNSERNQISLPPMDLANMEQGEMKAENSVQTGETEISAYLRDVVIEPIDGISIVLSQGEYIKRKNTLNPQVRFWRTKLIFGEKAITKDFATELDQNELHTSQGQNDELTKLEVDNAEAMQVMKILNARMGQEEPEAAIAEAQPQEEQQTQAQQPEVQQPEAQTQEEQHEEKTVEKPKEFKPGDVTKDRFVKLEEAEFEPKDEEDDSVQQHGKGKFSFQEIPYTIPIPGHKEINGTTKIKEPDEKMQKFDIDSSGQLQVTFDKPIVLDLIGNEKVAQYLVTTISLINASVKDSWLTAGKIRIDLGLAEKKDEDEEESESDSEEMEDEESAKKLFGENIHGTFAYIGAVNKINENGILAGPGKKSLGKFGVSKFLGFLDVEGDYPYGQLTVGFEKEAEKEGSKSKLFSETAQNIMGDGINIPIIGPLAFKLSISPSVSIEGSLSASLDRGKSFGEEMEPGESMNLGGELKLGGKGELDMAAGLALTVPVISNFVNADLKVGSELSAGINVEATADTALGKRDEQLKQTKDLNMNGNVDINMKGEVNLSSDVHFFIWNARLFTLELYKKEITIPKYRGHATRDKDAAKITDGWQFESMNLTAKGLGQKAVEAMQNSQGLKAVNEENLQMSKEAVDSLGPACKDAWVVLEELKRQEKLTKERAYLITKEDQAALKERINVMTEEVKEKLAEYQRALKQYRTDLMTKQARLNGEVNAARKEHFNFMEKDGIRQLTLMNTQKGGFRFENYRPLTSTDRPGMKDEDILKENVERRQRASIDFAITRILGLYDNAVALRKDEYDVFAREENLKIQDEKRRGSKTEKKEYTLVKDLSDHDFFEREQGILGPQNKQLRADTQYGSSSEYNYFDILQKDIKKNSVPKEYKPLFREIKNGQKITHETIKVYVYLKALVSGIYPEGCYDEDWNPLNGKQIKKMDPEEKMNRFINFFDKKIPEKQKPDFILKLLSGNEYIKKQTLRDKAMADTNKIYEALFESNLKEMTIKGNVDIEEKLQELDVKLQTSKEDYLRTLEQKLEVDNVVKEVEEELDACKIKLRILKKNVNQSMELQANPAGVVNAAKGAVNMIQGEYQDIASGTTLLSTSVSSVGTDSAVYKKLKEIGAKNLSEAVIDPKKAKKMQASVTG